MKYQPLNDHEIDFLDDALARYGNDDSVLDMSELDGFLTAMISGPERIKPEQWYPAIWGGLGNEPKWEDESELQQFMDLVIRHTNNILILLIDHPDDYVALFNLNQPDDDSETDLTEIVNAEEWCFGYLRGMELGDWSDLPEEMEVHLDNIRLHGMEENFEALESLSLTEQQGSIPLIEEAAKALHHYFLTNRKLTNPSKKTEASVGRNDPCPCGSGKKFKKCCGA